ncbi:sodium/glutamate symporter [Streptomyces johnsoniae]|uniref:Sodium:glutamate symporter n=1 Tax=Streptomyces johnsoniae TaxID=3075532 RepID=A0ABU2RXH5_9ACTN|nr:sodium:glutamate symporter [Streptomyces sp. DSM 41886]MDT0441444.1 sodium:glutamate symporter [Streptomyces sp. DSM 41886]
MEYTPWSLLSDAGLIAALLVVGALARAHLGIVQRLMLPSSVIAGFLGLLLGPEVLDVLPFSDQLGTYASVLIVVVFACLALSNESGFSGFGRSTGNFSLYSIGMYTVQVGIGVAFALLLLGPVWDTPDAFGTLLFAGWAGGFGTAAALGTAFEEDGWQEATSLGFTAATVGMLVGIVGGIIITNWGARRGHAGGIGPFRDLPDELRSGLIREKNDRTSTGTATTSAVSIEPLALQVSLVAAVSAAAYGLSEWIGDLWPDFAVPVFAVAFLVGLLLRLLVGRTPAWGYVDPQTIKSVSGSATDVLIVCGIASIVPSFVADYLTPLLLLFALGLAVCLVLFLVVAPRVFDAGWFEKALFTWGWATGSVSTGVALLRMSDPKLKTGTLDEFGLAYLPLAPLETLTVTLTPTIIAAGAVWALAGSYTALGLLLTALALLLARGTRRPSPEHS